MRFLFTLGLSIVLSLNLHVASLPMLNVSVSPSADFSVQSPKCNSTDQCKQRSWCYQNICYCEKGWITWPDGQFCAYRQRSKYSVMIFSIFFGEFGVDWFILSRGDSLYILVGILKCLVFVAGYVWRQLEIFMEEKSARRFAHRFSNTLFLCSIIWWFVDCTRCVLNGFPDGHGVPLLY